MKLFPGILLVDDDEDFLFVARRAIERSNLHAQVLVARDGADALRLLGLEQGSDEPGLPFTVVAVLLDLRMPGASGWDVLRRIRESDRTRSLPVVIVSSSSLPADVARGYACGANSYVVKRLDDDSPCRFLAEAARYWVELNEPPRAQAST